VAISILETTHRSGIKIMSPIREFGIQHVGSGHRGVAMSPNLVHDMESLLWYTFNRRSPAQLP